MEKFSIILEQNPEKSDIKFLGDKIDEYNLAQTKVYDDKYLGLFVRDSRNQIVGGLYGMSWGGWLEIRYLWIREDLRKKGYGKKLLEMAEDEGKARGCKWVLLDTFSFQAPDFYKKFGYQIFGTLVDFPSGHKRYYLTKSLV